MKAERYVIVDTRTTVGNSVMFWCWDHMGYTCDLRMAGIYTEEEANKIANNRPTDKLYRYSDVWKLVQHHVDIQDINKIGTKDHPHTYSHLKVRKGKHEEG